MDFIPKHIKDQSKKGIYSGTLNCSVLFADLAGFSRISQEVMTDPKVGVETIFEIIEKAFSIPIELIYKHNGFISTFIGDAFIALFPQTNELEKAQLRMLKCAKELLNELEDNKFIIKNYKFNICFKIGLSLGNVNWSLLKNGGNSIYSYYGEPIKKAIEAQNISDKNEIVICEKLYKQIYTNLDSVVTVKKNNDYFYKIINSKYLHIQNNINLSDSFIEKKKITRKQRLIKELKEFRYIISLYMEVKDLTVGNNIITIFQQFQQFYNIPTPKLFHADKGWNLVFFIGAPFSISRSEIFIRDFLTSLAKSTKINQDDFKTGIAEGAVYSGYIGSKIRNEYTCLGLCVNLSCRLMQKADWGEILVSESLSKKITFTQNFIYKGKASFKGNLIPVKYYLYPIILLKNEKIESNTELSDNPQTGKLYSEIYRYINNYELRQFIVISGDSGTGKSELLEDFFYFLKKGNKLNSTLLKINQVKEEQILLTLFKKIIHKISPDINKGIELFFNNIIQTFHDKKMIKRIKDYQEILTNLLSRNFANSKKKSYNITQILKTTLVTHFNLTPTLIIIDDFNKFIDNYIKDLKFIFDSCDNLLIIVSMRKITISVIDTFENKYLEIRIKKLTQSDFQQILYRDLNDFNGKPPLLQKELSRHLFKVIKGNNFYLHEFILSFNSIYSKNKKSEFKDLFYHITNNIFLYRFDLLDIDIRLLLKILAIYKTKIPFNDLICLLNSYIKLDNKNSKLKLYQINKIKIGLFKAFELGFIKYPTEIISFSHNLVLLSIKDLILAKDLNKIAKITTNFIENKNKNLRVIPNTIIEKLSLLYLEAGNFENALKYFFIISSNYLQNQRYEETFNSYYKICDLIITENQYSSFLSPISNLKFKDEFSKSKISIIELNIKLGNQTKASIGIDSLFNSEYFPQDTFLKAKLHYLAAKIAFFEKDASTVTKYVFESYKLLKDFKCSKGKNDLFLQIQLLYFKLSLAENKSTKANSIFKAIVKSFKVLHNYDERFQIADCLGNIYFNKQMFQRAEFNFKNEYEEALILEEPMKIVTACENLVKCYIYLQDFTKAIEYQKYKINSLNQLGLTLHSKQDSLRLAILSFLSGNIKNSYKNLAEIMQNFCENNLIKFKSNFIKLMINFQFKKYQKCIESSKKLLKICQISKHHNFYKNILQFYYELSFSFVNNILEHKHDLLENKLQKIKQKNNFIPINIKNDNFNIFIFTEENFGDLELIIIPDVPTIK